MNEFTKDENGVEWFRGMQVEREQEPFRVYSLAEIRTDPVFQAWREYKQIWKVKGWKDESSEIISRVIQTEGGSLSGTCKLLGYASGSVVCEFYFGDDCLKPKHVATYVLVGGPFDKS